MSVLQQCELLDSERRSSTLRPVSTRLATGPSAPAVGAPRLAARAGMVCARSQCAGDRPRNRVAARTRAASVASAAVDTPARGPSSFSRDGQDHETYVGSHWRNWRQARKALGNNRGRGTMKTPVFGILCRGGQVWAQVVLDLAIRTVFPLIRRQVRRGPVVCTDALHLYTGIAAKGYVHRLVQHDQGEFPNPQGTHINGLEGFCGYVKAGWPPKGGSDVNGCRCT